MTQPYDNRRFRTLEAITIPAGTLMLPQPDGSAEAHSPDGTMIVRVSDLREAVEAGRVRQLADGEA